jgi:hypothetical protein
LYFYFLDSEKVSISKTSAMPKKLFYSLDKQITFRKIDMNVIYLFSEGFVMEYPLSDKHIGESFGLMEYK